MIMSHHRSLYRDRLLIWKSWQNGNVLCRTRNTCSNILKVLIKESGLCHMVQPNRTLPKSICLRDQIWQPLYCLCFLSSHYSFSRSPRQITRSKMVEACQPQLMVSDKFQNHQSRCKHKKHQLKIQPISQIQMLRIRRHRVRIRCAQ